MSSSYFNQNQPNVNNGIGIINFLNHKNYFITGSTGLIAKVFVEKLLREVPDVQKIYLLMRAKNAEAAQQRLKTEMIDSEVFKRLKDVHGERYDEFMRSKLVAVVGTLSDPGLGMDTNLARIVADQIDVIVNIAAHTNWLDRYDVLLNVNVKGLSRLLGYSQNCKKLCLFLHVSTAYSLKTTSEVILEKPMFMEETIAAEGQNPNFTTESSPDIKAELEMVTRVASDISHDKLSKEMAKLGLRRARSHGWSNDYLLTKAMGEMLITKIRKTIPTIIIRPPIVASSFRDPFPGWIEGYRGMDPMILSYGKGQLRGLYADPTKVLDFVPVDMVANAMIAATAYHGIIGEPGLHVYHVASSMVNPVLCEKLFELCYKYFTMYPHRTSTGEVVRVENMEYFSSIHEYVLHGLDAQPSNEKLRNKLLRFSVMGDFVMFFPSRFSNKNTQNLFGKMYLEEKKIFNFDVESIDWEDYFLSTHFSGLRKHILKDQFPSPKL